ncbi:MAG: hypothetical protein O2857_30980, partial [Planctomycetota bacterium]|nr:hypothetical protein [Planctomycetota bacterium]
MDTTNSPEPAKLSNPGEKSVMHYHPNTTVATCCASFRLHTTGDGWRGPDDHEETTPLRTTARRPNPQGT